MNVFHFSTLLTFIYMQKVQHISGINLIFALALYFCVNTVNDNLRFKCLRIFSAWYLSHFIHFLFILESCKIALFHGIVLVNAEPSNIGLQYCDLAGNVLIMFAILI